MSEHHTCARCGVTDDWPKVERNGKMVHIGRLPNPPDKAMSMSAVCRAALQRDNAAKQQQIERLRAAIIEARRQLEMGRTWGGMSWKWHHRAAEMGYKALGTALESDSGKAAMGE